MSGAGLCRNVLVAAILGGALAAFTLRHGIWIGPDGWAYWQGSVSLLESHHYRLFFFDEPIEAWPPLYSIYLALWQALCGISGLTLVLSTVTLVSATSATWTWLWCRTLAGKGTDARNQVMGLFAAILSAVYWAHQDRSLLSENLRNLILPFFLGGLCAMWSEHSRPRMRWLATGTGLAGALLLLTHNGCIAVLAAGLTILALQPGGWPKRLERALLVAIIAVIPAVASKLILHQFGSHPLGLGNGRFTWQHYISAAVDYLPGGIFAIRLAHLAWFWAVFLPLSAWLWLGRSAPARSMTFMRLKFGFALLCVCNMALLFSAVWISDDLTGRYLNFVPCLMLMLLLGALVQLGGRRWCLLSGALLVLFATDRFVRYEWFNRSVDASAPYERFIRFDLTISHSYVTGGPEARGGKTLVAPPLYPWLEERLRARASGEWPAHLIKGNPEYRNFGW